MKTKLSLFLLILALCPVPRALCQTPQGFNYQAVARDPATGYSITGSPMKVQLTIQTDSLPGPGTILWQETHTVTTNNYGLFNVIIGKGTRVGGAASFSQIDWTAWPKYFIRNEIEYPLGLSPYKLMGVSRLWSVPFAMVAGDFDGPVKKLAVKGETTSNEEALFEVKNKDGQTVFAVFNEGVRVYVSDGSKAIKGGFSVGGFGTDKAGESTKYLFVDKDSVRIYLDTNPSTKKPKGGFAVGGYDLTKGPAVQDYLDVSSDSVRIYIDSDPSTKKVKGGFAVGGYDMTKGGPSINYMNVNTDASGIINPPQNRVLWYPSNDKNAFLAGKILIHHPDSIGENSVTTGYESRAKGDYSQAFGYQALARGTYSTSIGYQSVAQKDNSFAFGQWAQARNQESYAFGRGAIAAGFRSYAFGSAGVDKIGAITGVAYARGDYSFVLGQGSQALGKGSFAIGLADTAKGDYSVAIGDYSSARGAGAIALGSGNIASGDGSIAFGGGTKATEYGSTAMGSGSEANGFVSTAMGYDAIANGGLSTSIGYGTIANGGISLAMGGHAQAIGTFSVAVGNYAYASGDNSVTFGDHTFAGGKYSTAFGVETTSPSGYETVIGANNTTYTPVSPTGWDLSDRLFVVGNGKTNLTRSNAMTILKNGNVGIGTATPSQKLEIGGSNSQLFLNSAASNSVLFAATGVGAPTMTTRSAGTKLILYPGVSATSVDYGLGIESATMWLSIPQASSGNVFKFYGGTTELMRIRGDGNVGIGTTNPVAKLDVSGDIRLTNKIWADVSGASTSYFRGGDDAELWDVGVANTLAIYGVENSAVATLRLGSSTADISGSGGNIGIGTTAPLSKFHIEDANPVLTIRPSGGVSGEISRIDMFGTFNLSSISDKTPRNFGSIEVGCNLNTTWGGAYIRIMARKADASTYEAMRIDNWTGNVGIGTISPGYKLTVNGTAWCSTGAWSGSDLRWKKNIRPLNGKLSDILALQGVYFDWRTDEFPDLGFENGEQIGLIAQEVEKVLPELVRTDNNGYKAVAYDKLGAVIVEAIKEQQQQIESAKLENQQLKSELQSLREEMTRIKALLVK